MQAITQDGRHLPPQPYDAEKMKELLENPEIKEVMVFKPVRGQELTIFGIKYRILSVSKNGNLHLEKVK